MRPGQLILSVILGFSLAVVTLFSIFQFRLRARIRKRKQPLDPRSIIQAVRSDNFVRTPTYKDRRTVWIIMSILILIWILFIAKSIGGH
jgi:hypothetical protein